MLRIKFSAGRQFSSPKSPTSCSCQTLGVIASGQMKIYLTDQANNFDGLLKQLTTKPTMTFDKTKLKEKTTTIDIKTDKPLGQINLDFLFDYKIFPSNIMTYMTEWEKEKRKMKIGDTILQQAFVPPTKTFSQKVVFGVRINNIINETDRKGFSYVTIEGHVEKGESTFTIEQGDSGLIFKIKTFSEPGNLLTKLVGPIFTVPYQTYCTRTALENVKRQLEQ
ncbi:MAG: DUF1990 family protein [Bacteroidota bacterium]